METGAAASSAPIIFLGGRHKGRSRGLIRNGLKAAATGTRTMIIPRGISKCHMVLPFSCCQVLCFCRLREKERSG